MWFPLQSTFCVSPVGHPVSLYSLYFRRFNEVGLDVVGVTLQQTLVSREHDCLRLHISYCTSNMRLNSM